MTRRRYYLGLDQGTTGTTALLLDEKWNQAASGYRELTQSYPKPGWVEHDPEEIFQSIIYAAHQALDNAKAEAGDIACIGVDNQGETIVAWDRDTGTPIYPAIVWQDRRTANEVDRINAECGALFEERTGLKLDAYFGATKIRWVLDNVPMARELQKKRRLAAGTLDTWMIWRLTNGKAFVTDHVTASRTCLMNTRTLDWDDELLSLLDIPRDILPEIRENAGRFGETSPSVFFGARVPITGSIVDQQAALLGQGGTRPGDIKTTYGTGCFMMMNTGREPVKVSEGLITTLAWVRGGSPTFALDGGIYIAGAAVQWLKDGLGIVNSASEASKLALSVPDNGGLYFVPAFTGLAAPYWDSYARGMMIGLTAGVTAAHVARAALEATAYQVKEILDVLRRSAGMPIRTMRADGGGTNSRFLMQFQADMLGIPVEIPEISETTALGAAYLAAIGAGELGGVYETRALLRIRRCYEPSMSEDRRESNMAMWRRAVERARGWTEH